jgi:hypothetical protein
MSRSILVGVRAVAFFLFAACGGEKRKRSEDTSRSAKGLPPLGTLLLSDLATALLLCRCQGEKEGSR